MAPGPHQHESPLVAQPHLAVDAAPFALAATHDMACVLTNHGQPARRVVRDPTISTRAPTQRPGTPISRLAIHHAPQAHLVAQALLPALFAPIRPPGTPISRLAIQHRRAAFGSTVIPGCARRAAHARLDARYRRAYSQTMSSPHQEWSGIPPNNGSWQGRASDSQRHAHQSKCRERKSVVVYVAPAMAFSTLANVNPQYFRESTVNYRRSHRAEPLLIKEGSKFPPAAPRYFRAIFTASSTTQGLPSASVAFFPASGSS